jgi:large subunit ribosomal protein L7/L12
LVKSLEEEFGVTAAAVAVAWWASSWWEWDSWEKDTFNVELTEVWQSKIAVIKVVKEILWVGLKEAKEKLEKVPVVIKENVKAEDAEWIKAKLEEAWATVTLK